MGISGAPLARLSAPVYFGSVLLLTLAGFGAAMLARPVFGHAVLQAVGLETPPRALPGSFYAARVAPLFETHCVSCHGPKRQKGDLRLDSLAGVMLGGRHGLMVRPRDTKGSELVTRISLPSSDDKAMPPSGKTALTPDEITVIRLWVAEGASRSLREIKGAPKLVAPAVIPQFDPALVARQRRPLAAAVSALQRRFPGTIEYESRGSADLDVNASLLGARFGDGELASLAPLAGRIVRADLSRTAVTDASAPALAAMVKLRSLRLAGTRLRPAGLASLRQRGVAIYADPDVH